MDNELKQSFTIDDEIVLRVWRESDVEAAYEIVLRNRDHLSPYMQWMTPDYSIESARGFVLAGIAAAKERKSLGLAIVRNDKLIGSIGFVHFDWNSRNTEIGYWIDSNEEGKGIIARACRSLIRYAFDDLEFNRVEIRCSAENLRSAAIPIRLGFTEEGHLRRSEIRNGKFHDFKIFGLLADDPRLW